MGEAGGHLAQRGQAVALLHALVDARVLDGDRPLGGEHLERVLVVQAEGVAQPLVAQADQPDHEVAGRPGAGRVAGGALGAAQDRHRQRGVALVEGRGDRVQGLDLLLGRPAAARLEGQELALERLQHHRALEAQAVEEGPPRGLVQAVHRLGPHVADEVVAAAVHVDEVDGGVGDAARLLQRGQDAAHHVAHVDHVHELAPEPVHAVAQLVALAHQPAVDRVLEERAHRLEEDQDHEGGHDRVQDEQALHLAAADPGQEQAVDHGQDRHQRAQHEHLADQLVQVEEAVAEQRLGQEVQVEDGEHVPHGRERQAQARQEVGHRQRGGDEAADHEVADAGLLHPRDRGAVLQVQVEDAAVEAAEDVDGEGDLEPQRLVDRAHEAAVAQGDAPQARGGEGHRRALAAALPHRRLGQEGPEEGHRRGGDEGGGPERQPLEDRPRERPAEEGAQVIEGDHQGEGGEGREGRATAVAQHHRGADRQRDDAGEECG